MKYYNYRQIQLMYMILYGAIICESLHATINNNDRYIVAWHEAGHAIATIHNDTAALVNHVTIQPQYLMNTQGKQVHTQGHVMSLQTQDIHKSVEEFENHMIATLAGPVAEQFAQAQPMLTTPHTIVHFLSHPSYATDIYAARTYGKEIVRIQTFQHMTPQQIARKIEEIIVNVYVRTYKFIASHTHEVRKMAEVLLSQQTLSGDEAYTIAEY